MNKIDELSQFIENDHVLYHHGYTAGELRKMLVCRNLPEFINENKLYDLIKQIIDLAYEGLLQRGLQEEKLLRPLYERVNLRTNPAKKCWT